MATRIRTRTPSPIDDPIAELEANLVMAREQAWAVAGVSAEECDRLRPDVVRLAKAVCDGLRAEHEARSSTNTRRAMSAAADEEMATAIVRAEHHGREGTA